MNIIYPLNSYIQKKYIEIYSLLKVGQEIEILHKLIQMIADSFFLAPIEGCLCKAVSYINV